MRKEIPKSFSPAVWRGTLPVDDNGRIGLSVDTEDGKTHRFHFDLEHARHISESIAESLDNYQNKRSQSDKSSETLTIDISIPAEKV